MNKKADTNWVVISMVLAIIVLAILGYIFWFYSTRSANESASIAACEARGGTCRSAGSVGTGSSAKCADGEINLGRYSCQEGQICCVEAKGLTT